MISPGTGSFEPADAGLEEIETCVLLDGVRRRYGYDFRGYAPKRQSAESVPPWCPKARPRSSAYQNRILHDASCLLRFLATVGVNVTTMFREVELMRCLREEVIPVLRTYPSVRVWVAGCATGEETYSLAIVPQEEGLLRRAQIYATDINEDTLAVARTGSYSLDRVESREQRYLDSGGQAKLSDYYTASTRSARFHRSLQTGITWASHNLVTDSSFNDFQRIVCANVLIYFRRALEGRAHRLFTRASFVQAFSRWAGASPWATPRSGAGIRRRGTA